MTASKRFRAWWTSAVTALCAIALGITSQSAFAVAPSPSPSPSPSASPSASPSPEASPEPSPSPSMGPFAEEPTDEYPGDLSDDSDVLLGDGIEDDPAYSVPSRAIELGDPEELEARAPVSGPEAVEAPKATSEIIEVGSGEALDDAVAKGRKDPLSIVVGAGEPTLTDLVGSVYGEDALPGLEGSSGRPDLAADEFPTAVEGDLLAVEVTPGLTDDFIPGAAFAADLETLSIEGEAQWVEVAFDTSGFAHAFGGDYGDRLQFVVLPECALTEPSNADCLMGVPLETRRTEDGILRVYAPADALGVPEAGGYSVSATRGGGSAALAASLAESKGLRFATSSGGTIIAAVSGASGQSGSFAATDLSATGSWAVNEQSGAFTYTIPIEVPPATAGPVPSISLGYNSASTDGKTFATNGQTSLLGEGWASPTSYIERLYKPCSADGHSTWNDQCWYSPYGGLPEQAAYLVSLNGATYDLIWDGDNRYRTSTEIGWRVTRHTGADNGDGGPEGDAGEYFEVQTPDGSTYYFGYGHIGDEGPATNSVATMPVFGDDPGEPRCGEDPEDYCVQGYRWMLDIEVDSNDNAVTYYYTPETNRYAVNGVTSDSQDYTRALNPDRIEYGLVWAGLEDGVTGDPEAKVEFGLVGRCLETSNYVDTRGMTTPPSCPDLTPSNATSFPDVPVDLICDGTCTSAQNTPAFFTAKRLDQINTFVWDTADVVPGEGNDWVPVDTNQLITAYPNTDDGSARSLWFDSFYTYGHGAPRDIELDNLAVGDFDGDEVDDIFGIDEDGRWKYWSGGTGGAINLRLEPDLELADLRFGDFDGDEVTDVFAKDTDGSWMYSPGGYGDWIDLWDGDTTTPLADLRFGDFNGDDTTDVFTRQSSDGRWKYSDAGDADWTLLYIDATIPLADLRFGDFNTDGTTDVFTRDSSGQWKYSSGGAASWSVIKTGTTTPVANLRFGDFDGDNKTDVFIRDANGDWRYFSGGVGNSIYTRVEPDISVDDLRFGDFDDDGKTDVFTQEADGTWIYSPKANDDWVRLDGDGKQTYLTKFTGVRLNNRVDWEDFNENGPQRSLDRMRMSSVLTDMGGLIEVNYSTDPDIGVCPNTGADDAGYSTWYSGAFEDGWDGNTNLCFPVKMGDTEALFHKYVVDGVTLTDVVAGTPQMEYHYDYVGDPAWDYPDSILYARGQGEQNWNVFRGYEVVESYAGDGSEGTTTRNQYYRGLDGRYLEDGSTEDVTLDLIATDSQEEIPDAVELRGMLAASEVLVPDGQGGKEWVSRNHTDYEIEVLSSLPNDDLILHLEDVLKVIEPGDANDDGNVDLLVWYNDKSLYLYLGDGEGAFLSAGATQVSGSWSSYADLLAPGDWNSDGDVDLVSLNTSGELYLHAGNGDGTWDSASTKVGNGWQQFTDIPTPGDVNEDGYVDLLPVETDGDVRLYTGTSSHGYPSYVGIWAATIPVTSVWEGNFDGDDYADIAYYENGWWVKEDGTEPWYQLNTSSYGPSSVRFADCNSDGKTDIFTANGTYFQALFSGVGSWQPMVGSSYPLSYLALADFNGNGKADVLRPTGSSHQVSIDSRNLWSTLNGSGTVLSQLGFADFNGDGEDDIIRPDGNDHWVLWSGAGGWQNLNGSNTTLSSIKFGNFDGLGGDDIISQYGGSLQVLYSGAAPWTDINDSTLSVSQIDIADFDGDGADDIARTTANGWEYLSGASGTEDDWVMLADDQWRVWEEFLTPGDFDRDGHVDFLGLTDDGKLRMYPGTGTTADLTLNDDGYIFDPGFGEFDQIVTPGDFDGDDNVDLIVLKPDGRLLLYPGDGVYHLDKIDGRIVASDVDDDGYADLVGLAEDGDGARVDVWDSTGSSFDLPEELTEGQVSLLSGYGGDSESVGARVGDRMVAGDFDGDSVEDVAILYSDGDRARLDVADQSGSEGWWLSAGDYDLTVVEGRFVSGDFDNDGYDDIAVLVEVGSNVRIDVWLSTGSAFAYQGSSGWYESPGVYAMSNVDNRVVSGDFNDDGKDDIATFYDYGGSASRIHVWLSTGSAFTLTSVDGWWAVTSGYALSQVDGRMVSGDFNNDGKDDIATMYDYGTYARIHVWTSTGSALTYAGPNGWWESSSGYLTADVDDRMVSGDFDDDGKDDIAAMYDYGAESRAHVWTSTGSAFTFEGADGWWSSGEPVGLEEGGGTAIGGPITIQGGRGKYESVWVKAVETISETRDPDYGTSGWTKTTTSTTTFDDERQPETSTTVITDGVDTETMCTATDYEWTITDASDQATAFTSDDGWGGTTYRVRPSGTTSFEGECNAQTPLVVGKSTVEYDDNGNPQIETSWAEDPASQSPKTTTAYARYDSRGRVEAAWMPSNPPDTEDPPAEWVDPSMLWSYGTSGALRTLTTTNALDYSSTSYVEPTRGNVVKHKGPNDSDWTHYQYDALGLLVAGWAPLRHGQESTPSMTGPDYVVPTALNVYDAYADGPSIRTTPVSVVSAQFVADTGIGYVGFDSTSTTRRSYTFLDGWGRAFEQHTPSADGTGGRTIVATGYNDFGQVEWTSAPYFDSAPAQIASGPDYPEFSGLESATKQVYDDLGRTVEQSLYSLGDVVEVDEIPATTATEYSGPTTTVTGPTGALSTSTVDILGRLLSQKQCESSTSCGETDGIETLYNYVTLLSGTGSEGRGFQQVTVTDAEDNATVFVSNLAGQRTFMSDPNAGESTYVYNSDGLTTSVASEAGTITMGYDVLGRLTSRTSAIGTTPSSSASWDYVDIGETGAPSGGPYVDLGLLRSSSSTTVTGEDEFTTSTAVTYDSYHRPTSTTVTLPTDDALGDLSGYTYETSVEYDDETGVVSGSELPAVGGLPNEVVSTGYRLNGMAHTLTLKAPGETPAWTTEVVSSTSIDGTGLFQSREYGNGVVRAIDWDDVSRVPTDIEASFMDGETTVYLQDDALIRDVTGRLTRIEDGVTSSAQCFAYDGFNRLIDAWTWDGACGSAPMSDNTDWYLDGTSYATAWEYSDSSKIDSIMNLVMGEGSVEESFGYLDGSSSHAVTNVDEEVTDWVIEDFASGDYDGGYGSWLSDWAETNDDASSSSGLISTSDGVLWLEGVVGTGDDAILSRTFDIEGMTGGSIEVGLAAVGQALEFDDVITVTVIPDDTPANAVTESFTGNTFTVAEAPDWEEDAIAGVVTFTSVLPADEIEIQIGITSGVEEGEGVTREGVLVAGVVLDATSVDSREFEYDAAGRMTTRVLDGDTTTLTWDVSSNLVKTVETEGDTIQYVYNESGQRIAKLNTTENTAIAYLGSTEVTDPDTASNHTGGPSELENDDYVVGTRYFTFGGATVAVRNGSEAFVDSLSLLLGDFQGSTSVAMQVTLDSGGAMFDATTSDPVARNTYLPYGVTRGSDNLTISHGWLNQVTDETDTGLVYLNARYYDPVLSRFISPDSLMSPTDPKTLDPYRYADNNPVLFSDPTGLCPGCSMAQIALYGAYTSGNLSNLENEQALRQEVVYGIARTNGTTMSVGPRHGNRPNPNDWIENLQIADDEMVIYDPWGPFTAARELPQRETEVIGEELPANNRYAGAAERNAERLYGWEQHGRFNAAAHGLWAAWVTEEFGLQYAARLFVAHEGRPSQAPEMEAMDLYNFMVGARIGYENPGASFYEIVDLVSDAVDRGEFLVIGRDGELYYSDEIRAGESFTGEPGDLGSGGAPIPGKGYGTMVGLFQSFVEGDYVP